MTIAVAVDRVEKYYASLQALADVTFAIERGEFFGLLGPNGAGKTTLISCLAGLTRPDSGSLKVMGFDVLADYRMARRQLGVVPQELVFDPFFTVRETLDLQSGYFGIRNNSQWIDEILENLDLTSKADVNMRRLSGGMKRRVLVAQALVHKPPVIVLDEPTAGVDVELRQGLWHFIQRLNREGHTVILTTHYLEEAQALCGRIAMLHAGHIVALDTTANLLRRISGYTLTIQLAGSLPLPSQFSSWVLTNATPGLYTLQLPGFEDVERVLSVLREAGIAIENMQLLPPDLEQVFIKVMQDSGMASNAQ